MAGAIKATGEKNTCQQLVSNPRLYVLPKIYMLHVYTYVPNLKLDPICAPTLVEFLLGAVRGQSGSAGFKQGLSM